MGFRKDAFATVFSEPAIKRDNVTSVRISISKKNKEGGFEQTFGGYVSFVGTANAKAAAGLKVKDRIKLLEVDVTNVYDKDKNVTYTNFSCFSFEMAGSGSNSTDSSSNGSSDMENISDKELPF